MKYVAVSYPVISYVSMFYWIVAFMGVDRLSWVEEWHLVLFHAIIVLVMMLQLAMLVFMRVRSNLVIYLGSVLTAASLAYTCANLALTALLISRI